MKEKYIDIFYECEMGEILNLKFCLVFENNTPK